MVAEQVAGPADELGRGLVAGRRQERRVVEDLLEVEVALDARFVARRSPRCRSIIRSSDGCLRRKSMYSVNARDVGEHRRRRPRHRGSPSSIRRPVSMRSRTASWSSSGMPEHLADHPHRQVGAEVAHEVEPGAVRRADRARRRRTPASCSSSTRHSPGREHPAHQAPVEVVDGRVLEDEHPVGHRPCPSGSSRAPCPVPEMKVCQLIEHASTSANRLTAKKS